MNAGDLRYHGGSTKLADDRLCRLHGAKHVANTATQSSSNVAKGEIDGGSEKRYAAMMLKDWVKRALEHSHLSQAELARRLTDRLGRSIDRAAVNKMTKGTRDVSGPEMLAIEEITGLPPPVDPQPTSVPIMGYVGAGAMVEPEFEQVPPEGLETVDLPFPIPDDIIGFKVRGDSMLPSYRNDDAILVYREQRLATESYVGEEAAVRTGDGYRYLKEIQRGPAPGVFNLHSHNARLIEGVHLTWVGEIYLIVRANQIARIRQREKAAATRRARARAAESRGMSELQLTGTEIERRDLPARTATNNSGHFNPEGADP